VSLRIVLIHQYDPSIHNVGGIGTFISTFIKYAPPDMEVSLVGVTADEKKFPVGRWQRMTAGSKGYDFLPIVASHPIHRGPIPLNLRLTYALRRYRYLIDFREAIVEIHRIEPALALRHLNNPKVLFMHAHSLDLYNPKTEAVWRRFPWLYFWLERRLIHQIDRIFIVREDAVQYYREKYPKLANHISFLPTWSDESVFVSLPEEERKHLKEELARVHGFDPKHSLLLFVGIFQGQKDPRFLLESFYELNRAEDGVELVMIGEGPMESEIRAYIRDHGLTERVRIVGPQDQRDIARWMNAADAMVLSSAFEGMPRVVVEALQCGLPVASTNVGEAKRLIQHPAAGRLVEERNPKVFSEAVLDVLSQKPDRDVCQKQVASYTASHLLGQVYDIYRELKNGLP
jgi:glycosyltransferase involved in cell wall biosynthesis